MDSWEDNSSHHRPPGPKIHRSARSDLENPPTDKLLGEIKHNMTSLEKGRGVFLKSMVVFCLSHGFLLKSMFWRAPQNSAKMCFARASVDFGWVLDVFLDSKDRSKLLSSSGSICEWHSAKDVWESRVPAPGPPLRTPKGVLTGLQDCSPVVRRTRTLEQRTGAGDLTRRWPGGPANLNKQNSRTLSIDMHI